MHIFSSDNLEVSFEAHARIRLRRDSAREVVEHYSGNDWYPQNVARPYKTAVREVVRGYVAFEIKNQSLAIAAAILERLRSEYEDTPFEFLSVSIGNIDYPDSVEQRVVANLAAEQRRQRMEVQRQIAEQQAAIREIRAGGSAQAQEIEQATLTPLYVQHEAADLYRALADDVDDDDGVAQAKVVLVLPTRADRAGVPRIYQGN
jgi:regulator of protease activity HflC (stomatin/prohibitin superfamily)